MKRVILLVAILAGVFLGVQPGVSATVTCEVQAVQGAKIILINCNEQRAKGFKPGDKVKLKLKKNK
jgi:hypothetical protein